MAMNKPKYMSVGWSQAEVVLNGLDYLASDASLASGAWYEDRRLLLLPFLAVLVGACCFYRLLSGGRTRYAEYVDEDEANPELEFKSTGTARAEFAAGGSKAHATAERNANKETNFS